MVSPLRVPEDLPVPGTSSRGGSPDHPVLVHVALSRAAEAARQGHYDEAERLLTGLRVSSGQAVPVLHLRARILAQQGRLLEAAEDWKLVLVAEPRHEGAAAGLREVALLLRRPAWMIAFLSWPLAGALLLGLLAIAISAGKSPGAEAGPLALEIRKGTTELEHVRERLEALARTQTRIEERLGKAAASGEPKRPPAFEAKIPGLSFTPDGDDLVVQFGGPIFDPGSVELRPPARAALEELGMKLAPEAGRIQVRITLEAGKPAVESQTIAFTRARAVSDLLRKAAPSTLRVTTELRSGWPPESPPASVVPDPAVGLRLTSAKN